MILDNTILSFDKEEINEFLEECFSVENIFDSKSGDHFLSFILQENRLDAIKNFSLDAFFDNQPQKEAIEFFVDYLIEYVSKTNEKTSERDVETISKEISWRFQEGYEIENHMREELFSLAEFQILYRHGHYLSQKEVHKLVNSIKNDFKNIKINLVEIPLSEVISTIEKEDSQIQKGQLYVFRYRDAIWSEIPYQSSWSREPTLNGGPEKWMKLSKVDQVWKICPVE